MRRLSPRHDRRSPRAVGRTLGIFVLYTLLTIALTWPLARGLARDVPGDLGDPVLNAWIIAWDASHLAPALAGHPGALRGYWNPGIFSPHPLALAYSEHLTAQALQIVPIYALVHSPLLCYNLIFLSTFILSAFGMFLFVRELTGHGGAAWIAGLAFGFAPYRVASLPHIQVLSSAWMPFALLGFLRYVRTRRVAPLAWGAAAWIAQNLSCGYYLLYFSPLVALYLAWELTRRRLWRDRTVVAQLAVMTAVVTIATMPFLVPYLELRRLGFSPRSLAETVRFSADVYGYFTADPNLRLWGPLARAWPVAEGALFPGVTVVLLSAAAIVSTWHAAGRVGARDRDARRARAARVLGWLLVAALAVAMALLLGRSIRFPSAHPLFRITRLHRELTFSAATGAAWLAVSARARAMTLRMIASPAGFFLLFTLLAAAMSLGPEIHARGRLVDADAVYAVFYRAVPGFDGLRVPARFGMIVAFGLAILAGCGAADVCRRHRRRWIVAAASVAILAEAFAVPIPVNSNDTNYKQSGLAPLPASLAVGDAALPVYAFAATLPAASVLLELPLGEPAFDVRYMLYALRHRRALVNGYSGGAPDDYARLTELLKDLSRRPDQAWQAVVASGATHVIVHEAAYRWGRGPDISAWASRHGAREIAVFGGDRVFALP
jgi:hypothetical protein